VGKYFKSIIYLTIRIKEKNSSRLYEKIKIIEIKFYRIKSNF
jgi:hypothetical protein